MPDMDCTYDGGRFGTMTGCNEEESHHSLKQSVIVFVGPIGLISDKELTAINGI